jgi:hypothetical protein
VPLAWRSKHGGRVVAKGGFGGFPDVKVLGEEILMGNDTSHSKSEFVTVPVGLANETSC